MAFNLPLLKTTAKIVRSFMNTAEKYQTFWILLFGMTVLTGCNRSELPVQDSNPISVSEFGAIPNDDKNDLPAFREFLSYYRDRKGLTIHIPAGRYDIRDERAVELMNRVMSGEMGNNPQDSIYRPYFDYVRGLDFSKMEDIKIDAFGAELLIDGWMEPVSLDQCQNLTIKGLTIDYKRVPYSIGEVINIQEGYLDVRFDSRYPVTENMPVPRVTIWDTHADRMIGKSCLYPKGNRLIAPQTLRFFATAPEMALGKLALCNHSFHFRPAILIQDSKDVVLEKVTIHSQPGMGIVGHRSENLTFQNLRVIPRSGSVMSTDTDATHFTSCAGFIHFEGCQFEGQGDDSTNIHNYYYSLAAGESSGSDGSKNYIISVDSPGGNHAQVLDYPDPGDQLELVEVATLRAIDAFEVRQVVNDPDNWQSQITLDRELPSPLEDYYLINITRLPKVKMINCHIRSHRARGILIKTRDVLIEGCTIQDTTGTAIHVGAEGWWHEGPASADVKIRYNRLINCGFGEGIQNDSSGIAVNVKAEKTGLPGIHKRLLIEGNQIRVPPGVQHGIYVEASEDVTIRYNQIFGAELPIEVKHSERVTITENR